MKVCPQCQKRYPDNASACPDDGTRLATAPSSQSQASQSQRSQSQGSQSRPSQPPPPRPSSPDDWHGNQQRSQQANQQANQQGSRPQANQQRRSSSPSASSPGGNSPAGGQSKNNDLVGRTFFGEYTITKKLGEGGMGAVYLARQNAIDQNVALKVLHARAAESNEIVQRFHREAKVISMLSHPNIVRVFIFGRTEDDLLYLVMEFVQGRELRERLDQTGSLDELLAIKIMKQACSALAEAHDLGIIHRDLKPDNILLTEFRGEQNFVKILDFGIAKLNQPEGKPEQKLTQAGIVYGTPEYLSPEQAQALDLDQRTDIYSLGCILYELITGRVPFTDKNPVQILTKHVFEEAPKPSDVAPGKVAPSMEKIIMKAIAKNPDDRFNDAMAMFEALVGREREILSERSVDARETYFPGSELTGMHQVSKLHDYLDAAKQTASTSGTAGGPANQPPFNKNQSDQHQSNQLQADGGQQMTQSAGNRPTQPPPGMQPSNQGSDTSRKIIIIAIGVLVFILLVLIAAISFLLLKG
jgi:serine/threonine-protein kinase